MERVNSIMHRKINRVQWWEVIVHQEGFDCTFDWFALLEVTKIVLVEQSRVELSHLIDRLQRMQSRTIAALQAPLFELVD